MKTYSLQSHEDWDDIERAAELLEVQLGWRVREKLDGPDARVWHCTKGELRLSLVFDDMLGLSFRSDADQALMSRVQLFLNENLRSPDEDGAAS
jgi:hypothetical protein